MADHKNVSLSEDVPLFKEVINNAAIAASSTWLGRAIIFLSSIIIVRTLGADLYGVYILGRKIFDLILIFTVFGLDLAVVKFISASREEQNQARLEESFGTALGLGLFSATVFGIPLLLSAGQWERFFQTSQLGLVIFMLVLSLPVFMFLKITSSYFAGEKQIKYSAPLNNLIFPTAKLVFILLLFLMGYRLKAVLIGILLAVSLTTAASSILLIKKFALNPFKSLQSFNLPAVKKIFSFSSVIMIAQFLTDLMNKVDIYMIGYFLLAAQVGIYGVVLEIAALFAVILNSFNRIFAPMISGAWEKGNLAQISRIYKFQAKMILVPVLPAALFVFLFPESILSLFGSEFQNGKSALMLITSGQLINCAVGGVGFILTMTGKQKYHLFNTLIVLVLNVTLNYVFIKKYGISGAALATSLSLVIINVIRIIQVKLLYGFSFLKKSYFKPLLAGGLVFLIFKRAIPEILSLPALVLAGFCFILVYGLILFLLGLEPGERDLLQAYIKKTPVRYKT